MALHLHWPPANAMAIHSSSLRRRLLLTLSGSRTSPLLHRAYALQLNRSSSSIQHHPLRRRLFSSLGDPLETDDDKIRSFEGDRVSDCYNWEIGMDSRNIMNGFFDAALEVFDSVEEALLHVHIDKTPTATSFRLKNCSTEIAEKFKTDIPWVQFVRRYDILEDFADSEFDNWLIGVEFPEDHTLAIDQILDAFVCIASQVFGSVEEANLRMHDVSITADDNYHFFEVKQL